MSGWLTGWLTHWIIFETTKQMLMILWSVYNFKYWFDGAVLVSSVETPDLVIGIKIRNEKFTAL